MQVSKFALPLHMWDINGSKGYVNVFMYVLFTQAIVQDREVQCSKSNSSRIHQWWEESIYCSLMSPIPLSLVAVLCRFRFRVLLCNSDYSVWAIPVIFFSCNTCLNNEMIYAKFIWNFWLLFCTRYITHALFYCVNNHGWWWCFFFPFTSFSLASLLLNLIEWSIFYRS